MLTQNFGLIREGVGNAVLRSIPIPKLHDDYLLVRTVAIALNPTDWTTIDTIGDDGTLVGVDYAGIVEEVGKNVTRNFKKGDRIAGISHGANDAKPETGAFARFIVVKGDIQLHIPDSMSFEAACTLGCGLMTVGLALYNYLGIPLPGTNPSDSSPPLLIYGGSTATGTLAIQFAKLSGQEVITTCSPKHFELVKSVGADSIYDYRVPNIGVQIRADTNGSLTSVFDTVSIDTSAAISADALGPNGGVYCNLLDVDFAQPNVKSIFFLAYAISGESYIFEGEKHHEQPDLLTFGIKFVEIAEKLLADGKIRPHPQRVGTGGLLGAIAGMQEMREGKVSGEKLVYRVDETEWV